MAFKLSGLNANAYVGVQATTPPQLLYVRRAPTGNDYINLAVGTLWLYVGQPGNEPIELWMMVTAIPGNAGNWILLYPTSGSGASEFPTNNGTATPAAGVLNIFGGNNITTYAPGSGNTVTAAVTGTTTHAVQIGNGTGSLTSIGVGTNGQLLIGSTGADPVFNTLTSSNSTIQFTPGPGTLDIRAAPSGSGILTLTSNDAVTVGPSLTGNINVIGDGTTIIGVGNAGTNTITLTATTGAPYTPPTAFTPQLLFQAQSIPPTYTVQIGYYTQIGALIYFYLQLNVSSLGDGALQAFIVGMPPSPNPLGSGRYNGIQQFNTQLFFMANVPSGITAVLTNNPINIYSNAITWVTPSTSTGVGVGLMKTNFTNATRITVSGCYF